MPIRIKKDELNVIMGFIGLLGTPNFHIQNAVADMIVNEHRTTQQRLFVFVMKLIERWALAEDGDMFDARNEATVKACRKIMDMFDNEVPPIPYI